MGGRVLVTDISWKGFIAEVYEFIETSEKTGLDCVECHLNLIAMSPVIYGADKSDDWTDPKVWKKAKPSLGITVGIDKVKDACESARQNPGEENSFRQLRLNQWVR